MDKLPLDERASWAQQQLPAIRASAARPLEPEGGAGSWWRQGEKPWQLLATCFEIDEALASGSPEAYVSHQPVLQVGESEGTEAVWVCVWITGKARMRQAGGIRQLRARAAGARRGAVACNALSPE